MDQKLSKYIYQSRWYNLVAVFYIVSAVTYLVWLVLHLNLLAWWLSVPFFATQTYMFSLVVLSIINHWSAVYRTKRPAIIGDYPDVAVVVSTYKEPINVIKKTLKTILHINYPGKVIILLSNDDESEKQRNELVGMIKDLSVYWKERLSHKEKGIKSLHFQNTKPHSQAKAGNLNQSLDFLAKYYPTVDLILTQDADEMAYHDLLLATVGYFSDAKVAFVQTIKQAKVTKDDPFGNDDMMWYGRTAASRDRDNAMFACGSAVVWRISAINSIGGFSTWNLVEDLTTSYELLAQGWESRYHYEALSIGLAPDDLANYVKQRGTWAIDGLRQFFWDNPLLKKGLTFRQKLQFLETPLFYINGTITIILILVTSTSLLLSKWPTTAGALEHSIFLLPSFFLMEIYFLLRGGEIRFMRVRQFWVGLAPIFTLAAIKALFYGPNNKPKYVVTRKENEYDNYLKLVWPQLAIISLIVIALIKTIVTTPLYSAFDWAIVFWGFYQASYFLQIIRVSLHNWVPTIDYKWSRGLVYKIQDLQTVIKVAHLAFRKSIFARIYKPLSLSSASAKN